MTGIKRPIPISGMDLLPNMYTPGMFTNKKDNIPFSVVLQQVRTWVWSILNKYIMQG